MNFKTYEGKNLEELKEKAYNELKVTEKDLVFKVSEKKKSLLKGIEYVLDVYKITDIANYIKNYLKELLNNMDIDASFETKIRDEQINIRMESEKSSILIGKNGQTLKALQSIIRSHVYKLIGSYPYILLDVSNYQEKRNSNLEYLARKIAKEVIRTKHEVVMDNMNSYERRIIHNCLTNFKGVQTISEGVEPNRHIIVKPKED